MENIGFVCLSSPVKMSANLKEKLRKIDMYGMACQTATAIAVPYRKRVLQ